MSLLNYGFTKSKPTKIQTPEKKKVDTDMVISSNKESSKKSIPKIVEKSPFNESMMKEANHNTATGPNISLNVKLESQKKMPVKNANNRLSISSLNMSSTTSPGTSPKKMSDLLLPAQRIKMIMKSCPDVDMVPNEALHMITKATELFIEMLSKESLLTSPDSKRMDYEGLSNHVHSHEYLDFLKETIPKKITWEECQKLIEARNAEIVEECI